MSTKLNAKNINIIPLGDRVLVEILKKEDKKTSLGIIIPDSVKDDKNAKRGIVIAIGKGRYDDKGNLIPMSVSVGDNVLFGWSDELSIDGKDYFLVRDSEIMAIIK